MIDLLSDVLHSMRLQGRLYFGDTMQAPWSLEMPATSPMLKMHFVASGECEINMGKGQQHFSAGGLAILPSHIDHSMNSIDSVTETRLVCGEFTYDNQLRHPLFDHLPAILVEGCDTCSENIWLNQAMQLLAQETEKNMPGHSAIIERLLEIILIQALRHFIQQGGHGAKFLAGMNDRALVKSLVAMHKEPDKNWTVESLAEISALSRTSYATRFQNVMGEPPMQYLTCWRMLLAARLLQQPDITMNEIALKVGYQSEASFGKVFKRIMNTSPGRYRQQQLNQ